MRVERSQSARDVPKNRPARESGLGRLPQGGLRPQVVRALLMAIMRGELKAGDWLNTSRLALELGVSATPVREALVELAAIGMVEMQHNRGTVVREFGRESLREIYHVRRVLEEEATRCACGRIPVEALEALRGEMEGLSRGGARRGWSEAAMRSDRDLHQLIAGNCGNRRLAEEIGRYEALMQSIRDVVGNQSAAQQRALQEHLGILGALLRSDAEGAASVMARHIGSTAEAVESALFPDG